MANRDKEQERLNRRNEGLRKVAAQPTKSVTIELGGERAAILAAIRKPNETPDRTICRLIDQARPKSLDLGNPV